MKFFIDTANVAEIKEAAAMGVLDGVTTNPSLAAREAAPYKDILKEICQVVSGPVSAEVLATDHDGMVREAEELVKIADNIVIKIPTILEGLRAPFIGRLDDISTDGMELINQIVTIYHNYNFSTEVLVASVRHPMHLVEAAMLGADVITMPFKVIKSLIKHPLTDIGLEKFIADYKKANKG
jgi:transaldolase